LTKTKLAKDVPNSLVARSYQQTEHIKRFPNWLRRYKIDNFI